MKITPENCGKYKKEVRDWKRGIPKVIVLRCKSKSCEQCRSYEVYKYSNAINGYKGHKFVSIIEAEDWGAVRSALSRSESQGYARIPINDNEFFVISDVSIEKYGKQPEITVEQAINIGIDAETSNRRSFVGVFALNQPKQQAIEIIWPEPVFINKETWKTVSNSEINAIINDFLQYLSPLSEITEENVNFYLDYRSRLKADLVLTLNSELELKGFNVVERTITPEEFSEWNIVPLAEPEKAVLANNELGARLVDMIFFGKVGNYEDAQRNVGTWTDYKELMPDGYI